MIFLRQKHYGNARNYNIHNHNRHHNNRRNNNRNSNQQNRTDHRQTPVLITTNNSSNLSRRRSFGASFSSIDFIRTITVNERLATIGGLFGALSIIITGALLYAIFTAKSQDKWYYIIAVLINISLLVILMISAILFDRCYLKKYSQRRAQSRSDLIQANNRIININPSFYGNRNNNLLAQQAVLNNNNNLNRVENSSSSLDFLNIRIYNDIPPQYPGYLEQNENEMTSAYTEQMTNQNLTNNNKTTNTNSELIINTISNPVQQQQQLQNTLPIYCNNPTTLSNYLNSTLDNSLKQSSPPNYFDLYPNSANNTNVLNCLTNLSPLESTNNLNTIITTSNNYNRNTSNNNSNSSSNKDTVVQIDQIR